MFNFNFTGVSIMWYAIFDSAYSIKYVNDKPYESSDRSAENLKKESELLSDPKLYSIGKENTHFNPIVFWTWIAYGFGQALMVLLVAFRATQIVNANESGHAYNFYEAGQNVFWVCVFMANLTLLRMHHNWTGWGETLLFLAMIHYFAVAYIES